METHRLPILIWQDHEGFFSGAWVENALTGDEDMAAVGETQGEVLTQLKEYLGWRYQKSAMPRPDFEGATLAHFNVGVRPEYKHEGRVFTCPDEVILRVPCVHGRRSAGLRVASLPTLGTHFHYHDEGDLKGLVTHYVREELRACTPQELSRHLPPRSTTLAEVVLRVRERDMEWEWKPELTELNKVAEPLGGRDARQAYLRAWERDAEIADLVDRLGKQKANVLLVGPSGVGKTTILANAARRLERLKDEDEGPAASVRHRYWLTRPPRLISGMKYLGQWEERCQDLIQELSWIGGVLCVDDLLDLINTGGDGPGDGLASFFRPYLQSGEARMVTETTPEGLETARRLFPGFVELFQVCRIETLSRASALKVLDQTAASQPPRLCLDLERGVSANIYRLFQRFVPYHAFPGPAVGFLRSALERAARNDASVLTNAHIIGAFVRETGLPELFLQDELPLEGDQVFEAFRERVVGQDPACRAVADLVTTFKAGLNDPLRPLGTLLFCGPTGVGKTELARALADYLFGHGERAEKPLIRLDMSEYAGYDAAERLLEGANGEPAEWIRALRQQPFAVVLLDEVEKAAAEVFDILLSVFDEGRITDRRGKTTTFRSAVLIMTSNLGAEKQEAAGFKPDRTPSYTHEAMAFFRPEFFNRIDAVLTFDPLSEEVIRRITEMELRSVSNREGFRRFNLQLSWSDRLVDQLARSGFDRRYGARPLQRTIEQQVVSPLARFLVEHPHVRDRHIQADWTAESGVIFRP